MNVAYPLSLPGLARAEALQGDTACSRQQARLSSIAGKTPIPICRRKEARAEAARFGI